MRKACCTCGAGWTSNAFAWDEYINPVLWSEVPGGCREIPRRSRRGGEGRSSGGNPDFRTCSGGWFASSGLLMLGVAGCLL